jgi:hypothetical protein
MMSGQDDWDPVLKREVEIAQAGFPTAYRCCFRRERLYRYCHFLHTGEKPPFNLVGSWLDDDLRAEIALWKKVRNACFSDYEAIDYLMAVFEERFAHSWEETVAFGSMPEWAEAHLPVWDVGTESLLPQFIGSMEIFRMVDYSQDRQSRNTSYSYRNPEGNETLSLYLYDGAVPNLLDGLSDYIVQEEAKQTFGEAMMFASQRGDEILEVTDFQMDILESPCGSRWPMASVAWFYKPLNGEACYSDLSLTGFRGVVAKTRITIDLETSRSEEGMRRLASANADLADYFFLFR